MEKSDAATAHGLVINFFRFRYWESKIFRFAFELSKLSWVSWCAPKLKIRLKWSILKSVHGPIILDRCQPHDQCFDAAIKDPTELASKPLAIQHKCPAANEWVPNVHSAVSGPQHPGSSVFSWPLCAFLLPIYTLLAVAPELHAGLALAAKSSGSPQDPSPRA